VGVVLKHFGVPANFVDTVRAGVDVGQVGRWSWSGAITESQIWCWFKFTPPSALLNYDESDRIK
jgi:hypothetical protein